MPVNLFIRFDFPNELNKTKKILWQTDELNKMEPIMVTMQFVKQIRNCTSIFFVNDHLYH